MVTNARLPRCAVCDGRLLSKNPYNPKGLLRPSGGMDLDLEQLMLGADALCTPGGPAGAAAALVPYAMGAPPPADGSCHLTPPPAKRRRTLGEKAQVCRVYWCSGVGSGSVCLPGRCRFVVSSDAVISCVGARASVPDWARRRWFVFSAGFFVGGSGASTRACCVFCQEDLWNRAQSVSACGGQVNVTAQKGRWRRP